MKRLFILVLFSGLLPLLARAGLPTPSLLINVDPTTKEYYLSGSATGYPGSMPGMPGMGGPEEMGGGYEVFWDNHQPYDGGYANLLAGSAFIVTGNSAYNFVLYFHGNGNVNGAYNFTSGGSTTLTGNSALRFSYAGWSQYMISELEDKALNHENVIPSNGDAAFTLQFNSAPSSAIPEPAAGAVLAGVIVLGGAASLRRRKLAE